MHLSIQHTVARITKHVRMAAIIISMILTLQYLYFNVSAQHLQVAQTDNQSRDERARQILASLEQDNTLRFALERGDRGNGIHYPWMDQTQQQGIKQASFRIHFAWCPKSKKTNIVDTKYLRQYYRFDTKIDDGLVLRQIHDSGLEQSLAEAILIRAEANLTQIVRDLKSNRICGTLYLNLLDDEVLPILDEPATLDCECENAPEA